jgi:hypothetical protein
MALITATINDTPKISAKVKKVLPPAINLDELLDVETMDVANGYGLIYNSAEEKWVAAPIEGALAGDIDGGIF